MSEKIRLIDVLKLEDPYKNELRNWRNNDFVRTKMFNDSSISVEEHTKFLSYLETAKYKRHFVAFYGEEPFGVLQYDFFEKDNNLEFGYYLINEKFLNSGLGMVLEYVLLNHGFYKLGVKKVFCRTLSFNQKVVELHTRFGFFTEGVLKSHIRRGEDYLDVCFQSIFIEEWEKNKSKIEKVLRVIANTKDINELI